MADQGPDAGGCPPETPLARILRFVGEYETWQDDDHAGYDRLIALAAGLHADLLRAAGPAPVNAGDGPDV